MCPAPERQGPWQVCCRCGSGRGWLSWGLATYASQSKSIKFWSFIILLHAKKLKDTTFCHKYCLLTIFHEVMFQYYRVCYVITSFSINCRLFSAATSIFSLRPYIPCLRMDPTGRKKQNHTRKLDSLGYPTGPSTLPRWIEVSSYKEAPLMYRNLKLQQCKPHKQPWFIYFITLSQSPLHKEWQEKLAELPESRNIFNRSELYRSEKTGILKTLCNTHVQTNTCSCVVNTIINYWKVNMVDIQLKSFLL